MARPRHSVRVLMAMLGTVLSVASAAQGQYAPHMVKATVPFEFTFRDRMFPPGNYLLACTPVAVELRSAQGEIVATEIPHSVTFREAPRTAKLVFSTDTGSHVLSQIWPGAGQYGYELAPSRSASLLAKQRVSKRGAVAGGGNK
jgi:hypothetical protein